MLFNDKNITFQIEQIVKRLEVLEKSIIKIQNHVNGYNASIKKQHKRLDNLSSVIAGNLSK